MKTKESYLRQLPSVDELLKEASVLEWLEGHPRALVLDALRMAIEEKRKEIIECEKASSPQSPVLRNY